MAYSRTITDPAERVRYGASLDPNRKKKVIDPFPGGGGGGGDVIAPFPGGGGGGGPGIMGSPRGERMELGPAFVNFISSVAAAKEGRTLDPKSTGYTNMSFGRGAETGPPGVYAFGTPLKKKKPV